MRGTVIARGIDTLVVGYNMSGTISDQFIDIFDTSKDLAGQKDYGSGDFPIYIGNSKFSIMPYGHKGYSWVLINDDLQLNITRTWTEGKLMPEVMATFRASYLWREGVQSCASSVRSIISSLGNILSEKVSRCDIACDTREDLPQVALTDRCIQGRMRRKSNYVALSNASGLTPTGYTLGKGCILSRVYDKLQEIQISKKPWMRNIWSNNGWQEGDPVTRVEFQLRREFLKDFDINSIDSLLSAMPDIWHYMTSKWFTMHTPSKDTNHRRWSISEFWKIIQSTCFLFGERLGLMRHHQIKPRLDHLQSMLTGCFASMIALLVPPGKPLIDTKSELWTHLAEIIQSPDFDVLCSQRQFKFATILAD